MELLEVILPVDDEGRKGERREVAHGSFVRRRVLDDLRAKVGRLDRAQVLLVRFA